MQSILMIPKRMTEGEELIVVRRREYERMRKHLAEVRDALAKIRNNPGTLY